jgi:UDP-N-acetylmuramate dehydrogenase
MSLHTTFKVGGPADVWVRPETQSFPEYAAALLRSAKTAEIPVCILGGGANLVAADRGIRGIVLDTTGWTGLVPPEKDGVVFRAGTVVDAAVEEAAVRGWGGLEFLAGMPGAIGGAVWMNARCYDKSVSDVLTEVEILDENRNRSLVPVRERDYGYKKSPFQDRDVLILSARFRLEDRAEGDIRREMAAHRRDREEKGHYRFPSAGSAFKNNRAFGKPTGQIIDELGLRGFALGGAEVAPWHGNIIINRGNAKAADIRALVETLICKVQEARGVSLEPEILFVGDWG